MVLYVGMGLMVTIPRFGLVKRVIFCFRVRPVMEVGLCLICELQGAFWEGLLNFTIA